MYKRASETISKNDNEVLVIRGAIACVMLVIALASTMNYARILSNKLEDKDRTVRILLANTIDTSSIMESQNEKIKFLHILLDNKPKHVRVTGYHPASGGTNSDGSPEVTATMTPHVAGYTCAISTELVEAGWLGKEIYINGFGMVLANDRLAPSIKGFQIDLCKGSYSDAMKVGKNLDVLATLVSRKLINKKLEEM